MEESTLGQVICANNYARTCEEKWEQKRIIRDTCDSKVPVGARSGCAGKRDSGDEVILTSTARTSYRTRRTDR